MNEAKVEFYKWNKMGSLSFELVDTEVTESYSVWDNAAKKFIRTGHLPDGTTVEDSKYINRVDWGTKYGTNYSKNNQYIYNVLINDEQFKLGVGHGVNNQISDKLETVKSMGGKFESMIFTIESNDKPGLDRRYLVRTESKGSTLDVDKAKEVQLTEEERKLVEGAKSFGDVNEEKFMTFIKAQIPAATEDRAKQIYKAFF